MQLPWYHHHLLKRENRAHVLGGAALLCVFLIVATPKIPHSPAHHLFADMRNFLGVPNTLNVLTSFPFLMVGIPGLVLCISGACFGISLKGEVWGWTFFYVGIAAAAFGSAYYHLRPDDDRAIWDRVPISVGVEELTNQRQACLFHHRMRKIMIAVASLLSNLVIERVDERVGVTCLFSLLMLVLLSITYERSSDDLRLCIIFQFLPFTVIPAIILLLRPKYTHSRYWFWAIGFYFLARFEATADMKIYRMSRYIISGHSLEHLCLAMVPVMLTVMLWFRSVMTARLSHTMEV